MAIGGRDYIGKDKQPTLTVCELIGDEYIKHPFRANETIRSKQFPALAVRADQIFDSAQL